MKRLTLLTLLFVLAAFTTRVDARTYKTFTHMVNPAEDAYSIALRYGVDIHGIVEDNPSVDIFKLEAGSKLVIRKLKRKEKLSNAEISQQWNSMRLEQQKKLAQQSQVSGEDKEKPQDPKIKIMADPSYGEFKSLNAYQKLEVVLLLPLKNEKGETDKNFVDLYRGALLAVNSLKTEARGVRLSVYNTGRSADMVQQLIDSGDLSQADLIIGPVFEEPFKVAADYAASLRVPIVSPLAFIEGVNNPYVFQAPVTGSDRYAALKPLLSEQNNVIVFSGASDDESLRDNLQPLLPSNAKMVKYSKELEVEELENMLTDKTENVFIILPSREVEVDEILARISSVQNNLKVRSILNASISVVGGSRWLRFSNIDRALFFKLKLHLATSYHADRGNNLVRTFDDKYLKSYGVLPTLYSYRGYDVAKMFIYGVGYYGARFADNINRLDVDLLQTPYHFERDDNSNYINTEWVVVSYGDDFSVRLLNHTREVQQEIYDFQRAVLPSSDVAPAVE
ncbi:MAG: hypothetical protein R3Y15_04535 [Rikenellaceae bacterium]